MLCPFGPSEYRHLGRSPCLRQGLTPQRVISCTKKIEGASPLFIWHNICVARQTLGLSTLQCALFFDSTLKVLQGLNLTLDLLTEIFSTLLPHKASGRRH